MIVYPVWFSFCPMLGQDTVNLVTHYVLRLKQRLKTQTETELNRKNG